MPLGVDGFGDAAALPAKFSLRFADLAFAVALLPGVAIAASAPAPAKADKVGAEGRLPPPDAVTAADNGTAAGGSELPCPAAPPSLPPVAAPWRHGCVGDGIVPIPIVRAAIPPSTDPSNNAPGISSDGAGIALRVWGVLFIATYKNARLCGCAVVRWSGGAVVRFCCGFVA